MHIILANPPSRTKPFGRRASRRKKRRAGANNMAKSKSRRSSRRRSGFKAIATRRSRRRRSSSSFGRSSGGFLALPGRPVDLALGGAGAVAAGFVIPLVLSKIPVAFIQAGWGNVAATAVAGAALGGVVSKFNKSVGLGMAIGAIAAAGMQAVSMVRSRGALAGYSYADSPWLSDAGGFAESGVNLSGYANEVGVAGYSNG